MRQKLERLEDAARAAMVAEYRELPAAPRTGSEWLVAIPVVAGAVIVALMLLG